MPKPNLTPEILTAGLQGLEAQRARLDAQIAEVKSLLGGRAQQPLAPAGAPKGKRKMSAAGRRRIVEATRKRWAEFHRKQAEASRSAGKAAVKKAAKKTVLEGPKTALADVEMK